SLIHGDYNPRNSKLKKQDQSIKVFDWETFKIGPRFIDVARYLSGALIEYSDVKEIYLDDKELGGKLSLIEKIFFLYALILLYILTFREKQVENTLEKYITPALNEMVILVSKFTQTEYYLNVQSFIKDKEKYKTRITQQEQEISELKK